MTREYLERDTPASVALASLIIRRWRTLAGVIGVALVAGFVLYFVVPRAYTSQTLLVPFPKPGGSSPRTTELANALIGGISPYGGTSQSNLVVLILRSRTLRDSLARAVGDGDRELTSLVVDIVRDRTTISESRLDGSIRVTVDAPDPELAAEIANAFPVVANALSTRIASESAAQRIELLERQIADAGARLGESERKLVDFQEGQNLPEVDAQAQRTLALAADLQTRILEKELEVARLRRSATTDNPELHTAVNELSAMQGQLRSLKAGGTDSPVLVPIGQSAELRARYTRLLRDYEKDQTVYNSLTSALVQTQMSLHDDLPVVSVLDAARVSSLRSSPRPLRWAGVTALLAVMLGFVGMIAAELWQSLTARPEAAGLVAQVERLRRRLPEIGSGRPQAGPDARGEP